MSELPDLLTIARAAVAEGAALLASAVPGEVFAKGERDYVTELDLEVPRTVQAQLNAAPTTSRGTATRTSTPSLSFPVAEVAADEAQCGSISSQLLWLSATRSVWRCS